jgi:hypothetical protein
MTRKLHTNSLARSAALSAAVLLLPLQNVSAQMFHVDSVRLCSVPSIRGDSLIYTLDCYFQEKPSNYWSFYDNLLNAVVIEFMDYLLMVPEVTFPHDSPFKDFKVKAVETKMALSGVMTRMVISLDKGPSNERLWNYSLKPFKSTVLRITIWKKMTSYQEKLAKEKRARFITVMVSLSLSLAVVVTGVIIFLNLESTHNQ